MKKLIAILMVVFTLSIAMFTVGCQDKDGFSYWQMTKQSASDDAEDIMTQYLEFTMSSTNMKEFWINLSDFYVDQVEIGYVFGTSTTLKKVTITKEFLANSDGWYKVEASGTSKTFKITFVETMHVNEIYFVDKDDKKMDFTFVSYVIRPSFTSTQKKEVTKAQLEEENQANSPLCAFDEQDKFDLVAMRASFENALDETEEVIE